MLEFKYLEDYDFFNKILDGGIEKNFDLFDFRDPKVKRREFQRLRENLFELILERDEHKCQLGFEGICDEKSGWDIDHYIPLSTNILNKQLRHFKPENGKKVVPESYGSNHLSNLQLTCKRCNAHKKHNIYHKGKKAL